METVSTVSGIKNYISLTKPGIIMGNALTAFGGFALASRGHYNLGLFLAMIAGLSCIIGAACVFNNYIDREMDQKMIRTRNRPLAKGSIPIQNALALAMVLAGIGGLLLVTMTNLLTTSIALLGFVVYVFLYSLSKYRTVYGTVIGSIAGAVPPVVGYTAVTNDLDAAALILFGMIALWQMPHFYAISIFRLKDYTKAAIPVLPAMKGILFTKIQMVFYIIAFILVSSLLTMQGYTGNGFLIVVMTLGLAWLGIGISGFKTKNDTRWARQMFFFSLVVVMGLSIMIPLSIS